MVSWRPDQVVNARGQGWYARTARSMAAAGCRQSIRPCSLASSPHQVAADSSCGRAASRRAAMASTTSRSNSAPMPASRGASDALVSDCRSASAR